MPPITMEEYKRKKREWKTLQEPKENAEFWREFNQTLSKFGLTKDQLDKKIQEFKGYLKKEMKGLVYTAREFDEVLDKYFGQEFSPDIISYINAHLIGLIERDSFGTESYVLLRYPIKL